MGEVLGVGMEMMDYFFRSEKWILKFCRKWTTLKSMSKSANPKTGVLVRRNARTGQFIGHAEDGTAIARPAFKPEKFTVRELQKVIRTVRGREQTAKAG